VFDRESVGATIPVGHFRFSFVPFRPIRFVERVRARTSAYERAIGDTIALVRDEKLVDGNYGRLRIDGYRTSRYTILPTMIARSIDRSIATLGAMGRRCDRHFSRYHPTIGAHAREEFGSLVRRRGFTGMYGTRVL